MTTKHGRKAAIIGAGQTGATAALGLLDKGFDVTVYSDRNQRSLREDVPATGTALIFGQAQRAEASLGLTSYLEPGPTASGLSVRLVDGTEPGRPEVIAFDADFDGGTRSVAVDTRLKADDRLTQFQERGGRFVVEQVHPERLDGIAAEHDLTLVATGRSGLSSLFPVDASRTVYDRPQRRLLMLTVAGLGHGPDVFAHRGPAGAAHSAFSFITDQGEAWWGPYLHKDAGPSWSFLTWAKPGSDWERRYAEVDSAASALRAVTDVHREYIDWDLPEVLSLNVIEEDPHSWITGAVTQLVRHGVGHTASGHPVAALGDTAVAYDPIAGQGAQGGLVQAAALVHKAATHDGPFDTACSPRLSRSSMTGEPAPRSWSPGSISATTNYTTTAICSSRPGTRIKDSLPSCSASWTTRSRLSRSPPWRPPRSSSPNGQGNPPMPSWNGSPPPGGSRAPSWHLRPSAAPGGMP